MAIEALQQSIASFAEKMQWPAWATFLLLALTLFVLCLLAARRVLGTRRRKHAVQSEVEKGGFSGFQRQFLCVYLLVMLADWLQGTHMYTLYQSYGFDVAALFLTGFLSSAVFGTFVGACVDRMGRKWGCILFCVLEVVINSLEHVPNFYVLLVGRVMGGVSTSLLCCTFEAWLVTAHHKRGYSEQQLEHTFALMSAGNGVMAIVAGIISQLVADQFGDIGPFQVAIALTVLALVCICSWDENYGKPATEHQSLQLWGSRGVVSTILSDGPLWLLGTGQACFEGAMYIFVFIWVPVLQELAPNSTLPTGLVFSCFMLCITAGGLIFEIARHFAEINALTIGVYGLALATMAVLLVGLQQFETVLVSFLGFELAVGLYHACAGVLRSKYVPQHLHSCTLSLFRIPLNLLVIVGTLSASHYPVRVAIVLCICCHSIALATQAILTLRAPQRMMIKKVD